jgi:hypothetical protein
LFASPLYDIIFRNINMKYPQTKTLRNAC